MDTRVRPGTLNMVIFCEDKCPTYHTHFVEFVNADIIESWWLICLVWNSLRDYCHFCFLVWSKEKIPVDNVIYFLFQLLGEPGTGGSSTPSMVGSVKQWQKTDAQKSFETWRKLADANAKLETELQILNKFAGEQWEAYEQIISICSGHVHGKVKLCIIFLRILHFFFLVINLIFSFFPLSYIERFVDQLN